MKAFAFSALLLVCLCWWSTAAMAAKNDLTLWRFCDLDETVSDSYRCLPSGSDFQVKPDNARFQTWAKQFAAALSPKFHAPPKTLGATDFDMGFEYSLNQIPSSTGWDDALEGVDRKTPDPGKAASAENMLHTVQLHFRKGLPFSFEIGATGTYLMQSEMYLLGGEIRWAAFEGFHFAPEVGFRMNYQHLFGAPDLDVDMFNWDLSVGKAFPLGGMIVLNPYTGYSLVYAIVAPHVVDPSFDKYNNGKLLKLDRVSPVIHRWFIGLQMIMVGVIHFSPEIYVTSEQVYTYSFHLGAMF